jgi:hypothetical protein
VVAGTLCMTSVWKNHAAVVTVPAVDVVLSPKRMFGALVLFVYVCGRCSRYAYCSCHFRVNLSFQGQFLAVRGTALSRIVVL